MGLPWPEAERLLRDADVRYRTETTGAPNRPPHGPDVRGGRVREEPLVLTLSAFCTLVRPHQ